MKRTCLVGLLSLFFIGLCRGHENDKKNDESLRLISESIRVALEKNESLRRPEIRQFMRNVDAERKKEILSFALREMRSRFDAGDEYYNLLEWLTIKHECGASVAEQEGLYDTLIDIVGEGSRRDRQRTLRALMHMDPQRPGDQELVHELVEKAGCVVLQLAILWDIESEFLKEKTKSCVSGMDQICARNQVVEIYPYAVLSQHADEIEGKWDSPIAEQLLDRGLIENKWDYWGPFYFRPERVFAHDLALAYMAWAGDESAIRELKVSYDNAPDPKGMRDVEDKDKRYWYMLLCLVEVPDDHPPRIPIVK